MLKEIELTMSGLVGPIGPRTELAGPTLALRLSSALDASSLLHLILCFTMQLRKIVV